LPESKPKTEKQDGNQSPFEFESTQHKKTNQMTPSQLRLYDLKKAIESADVISKRLFLADFVDGDDVLEKFQDFQHALKAQYRFLVAVERSKAL